MEQILTRFDLPALKWKPSSNGASVVRPLAGMEIAQDVWNRLHMGYLNLSLGIEINFPTSSTKEHIITAAKGAWKQLRYRHPLIATRINLDASGRAQLSYYAASELDVDAWVQKTFLLHEGSGITLEEIRNRVGSMMIPDSAGNQTFLHFILSEEGPITKAAFLFHTHHAAFDGVGIQTTAEMYLNTFANTLSNIYSAVEWGKEISNILPGAFEILKPQEPRPVSIYSEEVPSFENPAYVEVATALHEHQKVMQNPWTFKPRLAKEVTSPVPHYEAITLSPDESAQILEAVKKLQPGKYTYTHLAHAALYMVTLTDNPPTRDAATAWIGCWGLKNARSRLIEPYTSHYPGYALASVHINAPVSLFLAEDGTLLPLDHNMLKKTMDDVRKTYVAWDASPSVIGHFCLLSSIVGAALAAGYTANMIPPDQSFSFSSDGIVDRYINSEQKDPSGETAFSVSKVFSSLSNVEPGPFFRTASWNNQITLSADYNANLISREDVLVHLERWKEYIMMVTSL